MSPADPPRVAIEPIGPAAVATLPFRSAGQLRVAVIVKATFVLAQDRPMLRIDPDPIVRADQHKDGDPLKSVIAGSDLVPYRPRADVVLQGHARAPLGTPTARLGVRLMVARGQQVVIDKRLSVQGPRDGDRPAPFVQVPLLYELAAGGADNPIGLSGHAGAWPSLLDAWHQPKPVGLGPIGARWPARRALLRDPTAVDTPTPDLPQDFAWAFYNAAPPDQRMEFLQGDEWVGFEGTNSQIPRIQSCLPGVRGAARVYGPQPELGTGMPIGMVADTLAIDADRLRASVVWRGSFALPEQGALDSIYVLAGVASAAEAFAFPAAYAPRVPARPPASQRAPRSSRRGRALKTRDMPSGTMIVSDIVPRLPATPFETPAITRRRTETATLDLPDELKARAASPMPFAPAPPLPPRAEPLPIATPFDRVARAPLPPPPEELESVDLQTMEVARELPAPPPPAFTPIVAVAPPLLVDVPPAAPAPKRLGQAFLEAMERASRRGRAVDSLAR